MPGSRKQTLAQFDDFLETDQPDPEKDKDTLSDMEIVAYKKLDAKFKNLNQEEKRLTVDEQVKKLNDIRLDAAEKKNEREDISGRLDIDLRKRYAYLLFGLVFMMVATSYTFIGLVASKTWTLSDNVLITVLLALAVKAIALITLVVNYLFKSK